MIKTLSKEKTYIPKFDGNRDLPPTEQCVVKYKSATYDLKSQIITTPTAIGEFDVEGKSTGMHVEIKTNDDLMIRKMINSISKLGFQEEGSNDITYIRGGADLLKAPIEYEPLISELVELFNKELNNKAVDEKN